MAFGALHTWHVSMRGLPLSPSPVGILERGTPRGRRGGLCGAPLAAAAVVIRFEKNAALSRGWCVPVARDSAVCEQNASHNTQIMACFSRQQLD